MAFNDTVNYLHLIGNTQVCSRHESIFISIQAQMWERDGKIKLEMLTRRMQVLVWLFHPQISIIAISSIISNGFLRT